MEPWYFFFKNLALNFNVAFVLSLAAPLLLLARSGLWVFWWDIMGWNPRGLAGLAWDLPPGIPLQCPIHPFI